MDQYQPLTDPIAPMDQISLPVAQTVAMSGSKWLVEILRMVFEILLAGKLPKKTFFPLRLVSKQFNTLITPLLYRHIVLNDRSIMLLVSSVATLAPDKVQIVRDIRSFTQHITLKGDLPAEHLKSAFDSLKHLRLVTNGWPRPVWPSSLRDLLHCQPNIRLSIVNLELSMATALHLSNLNPLQLVSCKILRYNEDRTDTRSPVKQLLLGKENLETLHLDCTGLEVSVPDSQIKSSERMPAVIELYLCGYQWIHSPVTAVQFWNWTRITHLELCRVSIVLFLQTVKPEHLINLRTFKTDGYCPGGPRLLNEGCSLLCELLYGIKALENLYLSLCWAGVDEKWKEQMVGAIIRHGRSLRYLGFGKGQHFPIVIRHRQSNPTKMNYVAELGLWLANLVELTLDNTTLQVEKMLYLSPPSEIGNTADLDYTTILAGFRNLRRLTIWMQPRDILRVHSKESMLRETRIGAEAWLARLVDRKEGARFENILLRLEIFYNPSPSDPSGFQILVARLNYRYDGTLPVQEHILTMR